MQPAIVRFEYRNTPARDANACLELLADHGYKFLLEPRDILAHRMTDADQTRSMNLLARISA